MAKNSIHIAKSQNLDGLEIKNATFYNLNFPKHFHLEWSLVFIRQGNEKVRFNNVGFNISQNSFLLIPPYSIHSNGNEHSWSYTAIYINSDVINSSC